MCSLSRLQSVSASMKGGAAEWGENLLRVEQSLDPQAGTEVPTVAVKVFIVQNMTRETK